ncbi:MAG TPA: hypothetical protein VJZ52_00355, partial [Candidatus Paceibacterota bacterium]|nr:hypothetical protein [Candidatus Paceibacterota bacterium]
MDQGRKKTIFQESKGSNFQKRKKGLSDRLLQLRDNQTMPVVSAPNVGVPKPADVDQAVAVGVNVHAGYEIFGGFALALLEQKESGITVTP